MLGEKINVFPVLLSRRGDDHLVADSSMLPMGCLTAYIKHYKEGELLNSFHINPLVNRTKKDWGYYTEQAAVRVDFPSVWLFSSYVWTAEDNLRMAAAIKAVAPKALIIMGGPHIPGYVKECEAFFEQYSFVDIAVRGEGEKTLAEILATLASNFNKGDAVNVDYSAVSGLTFRNQGKIIRTADRVRSNNLDEFPSPFLSGEFDDNSFDDMAGLVLETNRGCPYGCTYCDWGAATLQKIRHFDLERVKKEIDYIGKKRSYNLHIADANFGAFERDVEIAKAVVAANKKYGFPKKISSSNSKNASAIIGRVIKVLTEGGLITQGAVAIQTIDDETLQAVHRSNIKTSNFEKLIDIFKEENLALTSELLLGLPGQTYESHKKDLQYIFDRKLTTLGYQVQVMPNAPMNEPSYREQHKIAVNEKGYVISTSSFTEADLKKMCELFLSFQFFYMIGVIKYFLYYLQLEHRVKALDFIHALTNIPAKEQSNYPLSCRVVQELIPRTDPRNVGILELLWKTEDAEFVFNHLDSYYEEIFNFAKNKFGVNLSASEAQTIKAVQMGVMPTMGKKIPQNIDLVHDFVRYFDQVKSMRIVDAQPEGFISLKNFLPGTMTVQALRPKVIDNLTLLITDAKTAIGWELRSPLRFVTPRIQKKSVV